MPTTCDCQLVTCAGRGQVGAQNDSDSDDSDDVKRNSEEEEDDDDGRTQRREGSDYDSDKDPAWRPAAHKSPKRTRVSPVTLYLLIELSY